MVIQLDPGETVTVEIRDQADLPLAGVKGWLDGLPLTRETSSDGLLRLSLPRSREVELRLLHADGSWAVVAMASASLDEARLVVRLQPPLQLRGQVRARTGHERLAGRCSTGKRGGDRYPRSLRAGGAVSTAPQGKSRTGAVILRGEVPEHG